MSEQTELAGILADIFLRHCQPPESWKQYRTRQLIQEIAESVGLWDAVKQKVSDHDTSPPPPLPLVDHLG